MKLYRQYIKDVQSGARIAGELERLAVERFLQLCEDPRYYFDESEADSILEIVSHFRHTKGKYYGQRWQLLPWQAFFFAYIFGLKHKKTGFRVVRKVLLGTAKKSGKSEVGGALGVLLTFFDGEMSPECYSAANKYDQALFCWESAKKIVQQLRKENDWLDGAVKIYDSITTRSIVNLDDAGGFFKPIAADAKTLDGVFPHLGLVDEYHAANDDSIPNNLESGMVAREQPISVIVTTRGFNSSGPLRQLERSYETILRGQAADDSVFALIFSLDPGDDWKDESVWPKANPGIGTTPTLEGLRQEFKKAITQGATAEVNFRTKNLNEWTNTASVWIKAADFAGPGTTYTIEDMEGRTCFCGLDMASNVDIAAFSMLFPGQVVENKVIETYKHITRYYIPEDNIEERSRRDKVPYLQWVAEGRLIATPGNVIDYDYIKADILALAERVNMELIYFDRPFYKTNPMLSQLAEHGLNLEPFRQTPYNFNPALTYWERLALLGAFDNGNDQILAWMSQNVVIKTDQEGLIKFDKSKAQEKIDGMVSVGQGFAGYLADKEAKEDPYKDVDFSQMVWA